MSKNAIIALAVIKTNSDHGKNYLHNFLPFIAQCLLKTDGKYSSIPAVKERMMLDFGLNIPSHVIDVLFRLLKRSGALKWEGSEKGYLKIQVELEKYDFHEESDKALKEHDTLIDSFVKYAKNIGGQDLSQDEADTILLAYLQERPFYVLYDRGGTIFGEKAPKISKDRLFLFGRFVISSEEEKSPDFEYLKKVAIGNLLANSIFLQDPQATQMRFKKTKVYLDAPVILHALGYAGPEKEALEKEMLALLWEVGADLYCFKHTYDEVYGILNTLEEIVRTGKIVDAYGASVDYFMKMKFKASDVTMFKVNLDDDLKIKLRIKIEEKPDFDKANNVFRIDETALNGILVKKIPWQKVKSRERDVDSIAAIPVLRKGRVTVNIEESSAIFVTNNSKICDAAKEVLGDSLERFVVPFVITSQTMTNLVWLKKPNAYPDLPKKRILADCYAAIKPSNSFLKKCYDESAKMKENGTLSYDKYLMVRYSDVARTELMELSLGNPDNVNADKITAAANKAIEGIEKPLREQLEKATDEKMQVLEEINKFRESDAKVMRVDENYKRRAEHISFVLAKYVGLAIYVGMALAISSVVYYSEIEILESNVLHYFRIYFLVASLLVVVLGVASQIRTVEALIKRWMNNTRMYSEPIIIRVLKAYDVFKM